jgi:acetyl esterase
VIDAAAVEVLRDLTYASPGGSDLKLDLYLPPERSGSCPVVLYLHGGAFMVGDRTVFAQERLEPTFHGPASLGAVTGFFRGRL